MHHACKPGGSERNPQHQKDASKLRRARTTHHRATRMHSETRKRTRDHRGPPTRRPELPLGPAPVHPSPRRVQALNLRQPAPLARRDVPMCDPRARLAGRDAVRTPARQKEEPARKESDGAAQRRGASGVARCAWGCARFARKPPTGLTNSKMGCVLTPPGLAPIAHLKPRIVSTEISCRGSPRASDAAACGTHVGHAADQRSSPVSPAQGARGGRGGSRLASPSTLGAHA